MVHVDKLEVVNSTLYSLNAGGWSPFVFVSFARDEDIEDTIRSRMGWLVFFFFGLMISTVVVEQFEDLLKKQVALSYFVPLLIGHGGNSGSQTVTTVIRYAASTSARRPHSPIRN